MNLPNYQNFNNATEAYDDFIQKIMVAINKVAPIKVRRIKHNSQEQFDGEIFEAIKKRDKLLKKFKRSRIRIDKELDNAARYKVHKMTFKKKKKYFENTRIFFYKKPSKGPSSISFLIQVQILVPKVS